MKTIEEYVKKREYLVCVDSDGCAMDTMDIKHYRCFGPCMVDEWELDAWRDEILDYWNKVNLYTMTRGINRFLALARVLSWVSDTYREIEGIDELVGWAETSDELSNDALMRKTATDEASVSLKKALSWSQRTNKAITELPEDEVRPFPLVKEALELASRSCDVAIVSSANLDAVLREWEEFGLLDSVDIVLAQNSGSKAACIEKLIEKGYKKECAVMVGDAPGDLASADKNGIAFYPILVRRERESWQEFMDTALPHLLSGDYRDGYGEQKRKEFVDNLSQK